MDFLEGRRDGVDLGAERLEAALQALARHLRRGRIGREHAQHLGPEALERVENARPLRLDPRDRRRELGAVGELRVERG